MAFQIQTPTVPAAQQLISSSVDNNRRADFGRITAGMRSGWTAPTFPEWSRALLGVHECVVKGVRKPNLRQENPLVLFAQLGQYSVYSHHGCVVTYDRVSS